MSPIWVLILGYLAYLFSMAGIFWWLVSIIAKAHKEPGP